MAGKQYPLSIVISGVDRLTGTLNRLTARVRAATATPLGNSFGAVRHGLTDLSGAAGWTTLASRFRGVADAAGNVGDAASVSARRVTGLAIATGGLAFAFKRTFIDTASQFENLEISLQGIEGSAEKAGRAMAFIKDLTIKTPFELADLADVFRMMRGQGMDPMNGSLQALVDQTAKLGKGPEALHGMALQLSQAWSKGRLMAQDANLLAENGVPVWAMLARGVARANGQQALSETQIDAMTVKLRKMSEQGQLGKGFIRVLLEQMAIEAKGGSERMMATWTGMLSNMGDAWTFFKLSVMRSGPFDVLKQKLKGLLDRINAMSQNGQLQAWADRVGAAFMRTFNWIEQHGPRIWEQLTTNLARVWRSASVVAEAFGGWGNLISFGVAAYIAGPMVTSVFSLIAAIASLNVALAGTPAGWLLLGGTALIGAGVYVAARSIRWPGEGERSGSRRLDGSDAYDQYAFPFLTDRALAMGRGGAPARGAALAPAGATAGAPLPLFPGMSGQALSATQVDALRRSLDRRAAPAATLEITATGLPPGMRLKATDSQALRVTTRIRSGLSMAESQ